jgi:hypothetical protein
MIHQLIGFPQNRKPRISVTVFYFGFLVQNKKNEFIVCPTHWNSTRGRPSRAYALLALEAMLRPLRLARTCRGHRCAQLAAPCSVLEPATAAMPCSALERAAAAALVPMSAAVACSALVSRCHRRLALLGLGAPLPVPAYSVVAHSPDVLLHRIGFWSTEWRMLSAMWAVVEVDWAAGGSEEGICGQGHRDSAPHKSLHPSVLQKLRFQWFLGSVRDRNRTPKSAESKIETEPKK